ncbi:hypothetical protein Cgig2_007194 [Carnegiea gigantea]|uniref:Pectinesterase inhibitor domain-containing protein n=1 Tax=Carnegiea gigantea TaxID=171969 RepID=A0A9Q1JEN5_9CARY|nr:hypothetical protein Cgig2_007194 [Carnegiea gigantea]
MEGDLLGKKKTKRSRRRMKLPMDSSTGLRLLPSFFPNAAGCSPLATPLPTPSSAATWVTATSKPPLPSLTARRGLGGTMSVLTRRIWRSSDNSSPHWNNSEVGLWDTSTTDHDPVDFDDLVNLEELGFGNVIVDDQRQHCPCERFGDGGLMDITFSCILVHCCIILQHIHKHQPWNPIRRKWEHGIQQKIIAKQHVNPNLCYNSLSIYASSIQTNPWLLADTALSVALSATQNTSSFIRKLSRSPQIRPRDVAPMEDCLDALGDAVQDLKDSIVEMAHIKDDKNFLFLMSNIQTQFSAALANEDSCTDGFSDKAIVSKVKMAVTRKIKSIVQLTSNALALINNYASDHVQGRTDHYRFETSGNVGNSLLQTIDDQHHLVARAQDDRFRGDML